MSKLILVFFTFFSLNAFSEEVTPSPTPSSSDPVQNLPIFKGVRLSKDLRAENSYHIQGAWAPISIWVPGKFGVSAGYISSPAWTFEFDFLQGSIPLKIGDADFGSIVDRRYGVVARSFGQRNSFHFLYGFMKHEFSAEFGNDVVNRIPGIPATRLFKFESMGPQLGIANRWQFDPGVTFTVDWLVVYIPILNKKADETILNSVTDANDRKNMEDTFRIIKNFWVFDIFRFNLGYSF